MNALFNSALRQSTSLRKDLDAFTATSTPTPALTGQISTSLTSFSRTLDDYARLAANEPDATKQQKAHDRLASFRQELADYRDAFQKARKLNEEVQLGEARGELLGRRPHHAGQGGGGNATPENPYSNAAIQSSSAQYAPFAPRHPPDANAPYRPNPYSSLAGGPTDTDYNTREGHAFREQSFFAQTSTQLDEFLDRGRNVLGDLGHQREMLKGTQRRLYSVANTLGISGDTIRMVERRARQDKWVFWGGVTTFVVFCWLVIHFLR